MTGKPPESATLATPGEREICASSADLTETDRAVREGRVRTVRLNSPHELLDALWNGDIDADAWLAAGVQVDFADPAALDPPGLSHTLLQSWSVNSRRARRRRVLAGIALSAVAVAAAFVLTWAAGR